MPENDAHALRRTTTTLHCRHWYASTAPDRLCVWERCGARELAGPPVRMLSGFQLATVVVESRWKGPAGGLSSSPATESQREPQLGAREACADKPRSGSITHSEAAQREKDHLGQIGEYATLWLLRYCALELYLKVSSHTYAMATFANWRHPRG
jgi:hypothetical protein